MQTMVRVGSDSVWAEDSGGGGPLLVLLHEGIGDSRMWDPLWPQLTAAARVIRYDVRGFGRSPAATENFALLGDLRTILDHFGVASAHFLPLATRMAWSGSACGSGVPPGRARSPRT